MALKIYSELEQRSTEWMDARRGMVTASAVGQLITPRTVKPASNDYSRALTALLVSERITGWVEPTFTSNDMLRGILDEPLARAKYAETWASVTEVGFMVRDDWGWSIGYSPDGLVGDDGLIEIKSRKPKQHLAVILADEVPVEHVAQVQCGLLVSGRKWCDYVSFSSGLVLWRKRMYPDERWQNAILEAVALFEGTAAGMIADYERLTEGLPMTERQTYDMDVRI